MVIAKGFDTKIAAQKASVWGTPVDCNVANSVLRVISAGDSFTRDQLPDDSIDGTPFRGSNDLGLAKDTQTIEMYGRYDGLDLLVGLAFGRATTPTPCVRSGIDNNAVYPYYFEYKVKDSLEGYFMTLCLDKQVSIHEHDTTKINQLTISGNAGERIKFAFECLGKELNLPSTGTNSSLSSATEPTPRVYMMFEDAEIRLAPQSGGALSSTDQVYPSAFEITINNNLAGDVTTKNDPYIDEPIRDGFMTVNGSLTIPKYTTGSDSKGITALKNGTKMKMAIKIISSTQIGAPGEGPYYYECNLYFPQVHVTEAARPLEGPSKIAGNISFECTKPTSAPDGMDGNGNRTDSDESRSSITDAILVEVKNVTRTSVVQPS